MITHLLDTNEQFVVPIGQHTEPMCTWAARWPNMYTLDPTGTTIHYADHRALTWLQLTWPNVEDVTEIAMEIGQ